MRQARPPKEIPPPLELECLKALWSIGEGNVRSVQQQLEPRKKLAYTTVMTLLDRLARKSGVSRRKVGRAFLYAPLIDRETMRRKAINELAESLFEGSHSLLASYLNGQAVEHPQGETPPGEHRLDTSLL